MSKAPERPRAARRFLPAALIVGAALLAYWPALSGGYVWDDASLIVGNPDVRADDGLLRVWFDRKSIEYLPLTYDMHWLERRVFGGSAAGPHVINVLLHGLSAALLGLVLRRLRVPGAWLAALLFALHPVAVASAAWLSERKNTLSMALYLGSILAYLRFEEIPSTTNGTPHPPSPSEVARRATKDGSALLRPAALDGAGRTPHYLLSLGLFLLALLAKTSVVMLPLVLLLLAWWRRGKVRGRDLLRMVPFFALSLALGLVTVWFQWHNAIGQEVVRAEGAASRIAAAGWIAWFYLYKVLLPAGLCAIYPRWEVNGSSVLSFLPLALLAAATALLWAGRKRWGPGPLAAWAYFLLSLLPVLGFVDMSFMHLSLVADHLEYAAMPGILALAAALLARATASSERGPAGGRGRGNLPGGDGGAHVPARRRLLQQPAPLVGQCREDPALGAGPVRAGHGVRQRGQPWTRRSAASISRWNWTPSTTFPGSTEASPTRPPTGPPRPSATTIRPSRSSPIAPRRGTTGATPISTPAAPRRPCATWTRPSRSGPITPRRTSIAASSTRPPGATPRPCATTIRPLRVKPDCAQAYVNRGLIHAAADRPAEAMRDYDQAIAANPDCVEAWYNRGTAYAARRPPRGGPA